MKTNLTLEQIEVRRRVWEEAQRGDLTVYPDEDTVVFTRTELRALWASILNDAKELRSLRPDGDFESAYPYS